MFEVSAKLGRHFWREPRADLDADGWARLPDRFWFEPAAESEWRDLVTEVRRLVDTELTDHQREVFVALVLRGVPVDALADRLGTQRNALYKTLFDARRKLRAALATNGYLEREGRGARMTGWSAFDAFLRTDPDDDGCAEAMKRDSAVTGRRLWCSGPAGGEGQQMKILKRRWWLAAAAAVLVAVSAVLTTVRVRRGERRAVQGHGG